VSESESSRNGLVIAIDGPSGSGKSSVAKRVAAALGLRYLDTGAMYRALAWHVLHEGVDLDDADAVTEAARHFPLDIGQDPEHPTVAVGGTDVGEAIRETRIAENVSKVATIPDVRTEMVRLQREIIGDGGVVAEGRDITTVVAPDADARFLVTASVAARLARRALEVHGTDESHALEATRDQIVRRDADDSTVSTFHEAAEGVTVVDSSDMTLEETVETVLRHIEEQTS
jgi:cytidylate kinase